LQNRNSSSAEVCQGALEYNGSIDFLPNVESLHLLTFSVRLHDHIHNCLVQTSSRVQLCMMSYKWWYTWTCPTLPETYH